MRKTSRSLNILSGNEKAFAKSQNQTFAKQSNNNLLTSECVYCILSDVMGNNQATNKNFNPLVEKSRNTKACNWTAFCVIACGNCQGSTVGLQQGME